MILTAPVVFAASVARCAAVVCPQLQNFASAQPPGLGSVRPMALLVLTLPSLAGERPLLPRLVLRHAGRERPLPPQHAADGSVRCSRGSSYAGREWPLLSRRAATPGGSSRSRSSRCVPDIAKELLVADVAMAHLEDSVEVFNGLGSSWLRWHQRLSPSPAEDQSLPWGR